MWLSIVGFFNVSNQLNALEDNQNTNISCLGWKRFPHHYPFEGGIVESLGRRCNSLASGALVCPFLCFQS